MVAKGQRRASKSDNSPVRENVLRNIRERSLMRAGDRVAVAVSGGADSVALLRVLLALRADLGIVLAVAHFNHGLRGEQSAADEAFVSELAGEHGLDFFVGHGNVRDHAFTSKLSIEAAGRELRYRWFAALTKEQRLDVIATAHTLDDQAETVLLKLLRGAGTRGLSGVYPILEVPRFGAEASLQERAVDGAPFDKLRAGSEGAPLHPESEGASDTRTRIVRPLLCVSREEVEAYLTSLGQNWREDESNLDRRFLRNRVRHELLPLLEGKYNPNIRQVLSDLADLSRGEEECWQELVERGLATRKRDDRLDLHGFPKLPVALQRRLLRRFAEGQHLTLEFEHIEKLRHCALGEVSKAELPGGRIVANVGGSLGLRPRPPKAAESYRYVLPVPGEVHIAELGLTLRARIVAAGFAPEAPHGELLSLDLIGAELVVRNWLPGDRFCPAHNRSGEKLKRLFLEKRVPAEERPSWPVVLHESEIVWVRGFPAAKAYSWRGEGEAVRIEAVRNGL